MWPYFFHPLKRHIRQVWLYNMHVSVVIALLWTNVHKYMYVKIYIHIVFRLFTSYDNFIRVFKETHKSLVITDNCMYFSTHVLYTCSIYKQIPMKYINYYLYRIHSQIKQRDVIIVLYIWRNTLSETGYDMGILLIKWYETKVCTWISHLLT